MFRHSFWIAASTIAIAAAAVSARQAPPAQPLPQFRSSIDTVHLDVSVLDRTRRPVRGLTPADFTILEDGKPQHVAVFQAVDIPDPEPPRTAWMREVAPDVATNDGIQDRRLFLILMDDMTIQADPAALQKARDIARLVIDRLGPSDLAAVIFTRDNRFSRRTTPRTSHACVRPWTSFPSAFATSAGSTPRPAKRSQVRTTISMNRPSSCSTRRWRC